MCALAHHGVYVCGSDISHGSECYQLKIYSNTLLEIAWSDSIFGALCQGHLEVKSHNKDIFCWLLQPDSGLLVTPHTQHIPHCMSILSYSLVMWLIPYLCLSSPRVAGTMHSVCLYIWEKHLREYWMDSFQNLLKCSPQWPCKLITSSGLKGEGQKRVKFTYIDAYAIHSKLTRNRRHTMPRLIEFNYTHSTQNAPHSPMFSFPYILPSSLLIPSFATLQLKLLPIRQVFAVSNCLIFRIMYRQMDWWSDHVDPSMLTSWCPYS